MGLGPGIGEDAGRTGRDEQRAWMTIAKDPVYGGKQVVEKMSLVRR